MWASIWNLLSDRLISMFHTVYRVTMPKPVYRDWQSDLSWWTGIQTKGFHIWHVIVSIRCFYDQHFYQHGPERTPSTWSVDSFIHFPLYLVWPYDLFWFCTLPTKFCVRVMWQKSLPDLITHIYQTKNLTYCQNKTCL